MLASPEKKFAASLAGNTITVLAKSDALIQTETFFDRTCHILVLANIVLFFVLHLTLRSPVLLSFPYSHVYNPGPWDTVAAGTEFNNVYIMDPTKHLKKNIIRNVKVVKVFDSKAKPLLLRFTYEDGDCNHVIAKKGMLFFWKERENAKPWEKISIFNFL